MSASGFPNQNLIVGWVLRIVAIPNINPHQIMKTTHALTKQAITRKQEKKVVAPISEAKEVELEKVPESEIKRPAAKGWVKQEGIKSSQELEDEKRQAFQERVKYIKEEKRAQIQDRYSKATKFHDLQQEQRRRELSAIQEGKEREREISDKAYLMLEAGTKLKDGKKFEEAYEKYIMGRDLFKKIGWEHDVSRINNDLMITLKKEMKQTEKLKVYKKKKVEEKEELEVKIGNKERILNLLKFNALTSKEIAKELNLSDKNTRTYLLRLKKEDKIKSINKKGRFLIYTHQRPSISRNQNNEIGSLREDLSYLLNLIEMKITPKDGVKFNPTDIMNIRKIEERIAYNIGGNLEGSQVVKDLIDFEQSFKEEINDKITKLEEKVDFITSRKVKSIKDEILEVNNGTTVLNIEGYLRKPDSVIKYLSDEKTSTPKDLLVCNVCGAIFSYDYLYCSKCGNKLLKKQESKLIDIQKSVAPEEKIAIPIISNKLRGIKAKPKRFDRGSILSKPLFSPKEGQVVCENCRYTIVKPFPKDELCPKCGKFLINLFKYVDNTDVESIKLEPKLFEPKTVTASSKIHGVRKKAKDKDISLNHDVINLNGDNEYLKFCGITTTDRTQLFASNKKWLYFLELTNNLDFIATSILGGDLDKMLLKSENDMEEKCQFFEKNKLIYVIFGKFPDKKGKWFLEQMDKHFSELIRDKDVNNLSKIDKFNIEKKFRGHLLFIFKQYMQLEDVFTDQEIPYIDDWLRLYYVGLSSMSIGVISILLDDEEKLNVEVPGEFENPAEEVEMKESLLTAKIEAIAANTLGNTGAYPRWIAVKLGFQKYRFLTFKKYKNNYFLSCLSEGNLQKIDSIEAQFESILFHGIDTPFSGNLRPFNKLKTTIKELVNQIPGRKYT